MADASPKVVIWGASGHAKVCAEALRLSGYEVAGFVDDTDASRRGAPFEGAAILGGREALPGLRAAGVRFAFVAVGDCAARLRLAEAARAAGFELAVAVHPGACVSGGASVGPGTLVAAGAVLNPGTRTGACVIVNTLAGVDHDCEIADGAHIGPSACLGGGVRIGKGAWIGIGAVLKDRVSVGAGSIVGAGALVLKDVPEGVVAYGSPAEVVRRVP